MAQSINDLAVGSKVKFGRYSVESEESQDIIWQIADKNHTGYPDDSITLITEKIIDIRAFDAKEPSNSDSNRQKYGNNRYKDSNIRQWLNKSGYPWFQKTHGADEPPTEEGTNNYGTGYDDKPGFLSDFTDEELNAILDTTLTVAKNTAVDGGGTETVVDKIFLASVTEVGLANEPGGAEGSLLPLFSDDASRVAVVTKQVEDHSNYDKTGAWYWWLRSPSSSGSHHVRYVNASGALINNNAYRGSHGVRPLCNLKSDILVSDDPDVDEAYTIIFAIPHIITLDKPITINAGEKLERVKFNPKTNGNPMNLKYTDTEKLVYETENLNTDVVDLEIIGKDGKIDKIAYTIS